MKLKRILALAVSLAMVLSIVPAFEITAGAAAPQRTAADLIRWSSYSFIADNIANGSGWGAIEWTDSTVSGTSWEGWSGEQKLFKVADDTTIIDAGNTGGTIKYVYPNDTVKNGTKDKDFIVVKWEVDGPAAEDFGILNGDGSIFDVFRINGTNATGLTQEANAGGGTWDGQFANYTYEDNPDAADGSADVRTAYFMAYENTSGGGYKASYYYRLPGDTGAPTWIGTKTYASGTVSGFTGIAMNTPTSNWFRIHELQIYAGNYPTDISPATTNLAAALTFTYNGSAINPDTSTTFSDINARCGYAVFEIPEALKNRTLKVKLSAKIKEYPNYFNTATAALSYFLTTDTAATISGNQIAYINDSTNGKAYTAANAGLYMTSGYENKFITSGEFSIDTGNNSTLVISVPKPNNSGNSGAHFYDYTVAEESKPYIEITPLVDVTVKYVDNADGTTVVGSYVKRLSEGTEFTPSVTASYYASETTGYLYNIVGTPATITVSPTSNSSVITVAEYKGLVKKNTTDTNYNYVENGDFETGDMTGYDAAFASSSNFAVIDGSNNEGSKVLKHTLTADWNSNTYDGIGGDRSFQKLVTSIESGKNYYYSIDVYENGSGGLFSSFAFTNGKLTAATLSDGSAVVYPADGCLSSVSGTSETAGLQRADFNYPYQWHTYSGLVTAPESATAFEFDVYYLCDGNGTMFDNVQFYQVKDLAESNAGTIGTAINKMSVPSVVKDKIDLPTTTTDELGNTVTVTWEDKSGTIDANGNVVNRPSDITPVTLTPHGTVTTSSGATVTGDGNDRTVTVFPDSLAGGTYTAHGNGVEGVVFDIPATPTVTLANLTDATGTLLTESTGWTRSTAADGDVTYYTTNAHLGSDKVSSIKTNLKTAGSLKANTLYLAVLTARNQSSDKWTAIWSEKGQSGDPIVDFTETGDAWNREALMFDSGSYEEINLALVWLDANKSAIADFELFELVPQTDSASVTINFTDGTNQIQASQTAVNVFAGTEYKYTPEYMLTTTEDNSTVYWELTGEKTKTITLTAGENTIDAVYRRVDFKDVTMPTGNVIIGETAYTFTGKTNKVINPSFETTSGNFSIYGWHSAKDGSLFGAAATLPHAFKVNTQKYYYINETPDATNGTSYTDTHTPHHGDWAFGSRYNDGENNSAQANGLCSITNNYYTGVGTFYFSYYIKAFTDDECMVTIDAVSSADTQGVGDKTSEGKTDLISNAQENNADGTSKTTVVAADWTKVEKIVTTTAENPYVQFNAFWLGGAGDNTPSFLFDEFMLVEVMESANATAKVTARYSLDGTVIDELTQTDVILKGETIVLNEVSYISNGKYYKYDAVTHKDVQTDIDVTYTLIEDTTRSIPTSVFSYNFNTGETIWADDNGFSAADKSATISIGWGNFRQTVMTFPMIVPTDGKAITSATLNVNIGYTNNNTVPYTVYAFKPQYVDVANVTMQNVTTGTSINQKSVISQLGAVEVANTSVGSGWNSIDLDLSGVMEEDTLALLIVSSSQAYTLSAKDAATAPYLSEISGRTYNYNNYSLGGYIMKNNVGYNTPLNEIFMLGAHDSMTEYAKMTGDVDPGMEITEGGATALGIGNIHYYATQKSDIITLLNSGVRYLDVRLTRHNSGSTDWYATHTNIAGYFGSEGGDNGENGYAQQIVKWLHDNPGEVLVFDLQWLYDVDATTNENGDALEKGQKGIGNKASYDAVRRILENTKDEDGKSLYSYFYNATGKHPNEITYGQLTSNGMTSRVVGFSKDISPNRSTGQSAGIAKFMWRDWFYNGIYNTDNSINSNATLWSEWPNKYKQSDVASALDGYAAKKAAAPDSYSNKLGIMQAVRSTVIGSSGGFYNITGTESTNFLGFETGAPESPQTNIDFYGNDNFLTWLKQMPVFMVDYSNVGADSDPDGRTATVTSKTSTVNNADTDFNPTVITDLARFNRAKKFNFSDYTVDHDITFTDEASGAMVTGSNFELPVSIRLDVDSVAVTAEAPTILEGKNVVQTIGPYAMVFNRFERDSSADNNVRDLGTAVTIAFKETLIDSDINTLAVLKLNEASNTWEEVLSGFDKTESTVTLTDKVTTLDGTYMVVELEGEADEYTIKYVEKDATPENILKQEIKRYPVGTASDIVTIAASTNGGGYYFEGDNNAYIVEPVNPKTYTIADADANGVITVEFTVLRENLTVADNFANGGGSADCNNTANLIFLGANGVAQAALTDADNVSTTDRGNVTVGDSRIGLISFKRPAVAANQAVTLNVYVPLVNENLNNNQYMKLAAIPVSGLTNLENDKPIVGEKNEVKNADGNVIESGDGYKANDYKYDDTKAIWSIEKNVSTTETSGAQRACNVWVAFDVTDAVNAATEEYITFALYAPSAGAYIADREKAVAGGDYEGKAAYLEIADGYTVDVTGASKLTKNGSNVDSTVSVVVAKDSYITATADSATAAFVDGSNNLYTLTNGKAKIDSFTGDSVISGIGTGISVASGAQVRIGQGVDANDKIAGSKEGPLDSTTASSGLRFIGLIDDTGLASYHNTEQGKAKNIEVGIEITAAGSETSVQIPAVSFQDAEAKVFSAAIVNLAVSNYNRVFTAKPYVKVDGGEPYYGSNSVSRSIYEVAAGILVDGTPAVEGEPTATTGGVEFDEASAYVQKVLNAYVNQVGIRLELTPTGTQPIGVRSYGNTGSYQGGKDTVNGPKVFFTVDSSKNTETGVYTVIITPQNNAKIFSYWNEYIRLNNQSLSAYITNAESALNAETGVLTLTIDPNNSSSSSGTTEQPTAE